MDDSTNAALLARLRGTAVNNPTQAEKSALEMISGANKEFSSTLSKEATAKEAQRIADEKQAAIDAEEARKRAIRDALSTDQFLFSDVTGGRLPSSGIDHVMFKYPEGTWNEDMETDIPEVDPFFHWDVEVLEALWLGYIMNEKCLAVGPPGTGKTSSTHQLAAWIKQPYARFNGKDGIEPSAFLGQAWAEDGAMVWKDGLMTQAVENGYYTVIDEVFKLPPGIQMALQSLYEKKGFLMLDEKPGTIKDKHVHPRQEFRLVGTDNTKGTGDDLDKYTAGQMQDTSTLDRFGITLEVGYLKKDIEVKVIGKMFPSLSASVCNQAVSFANLVRNGYLNSGDLSLTMSLRGLSVVCGLMERDIPFAKAIDMAYINKLGDDAEIKCAGAFVGDCI